MHRVDDVKPRPWQAQRPPTRLRHPWPQIDRSAARPCPACHRFAAPAVSNPLSTASWYASALVSRCWALLRPSTRLVGMGSDDGCLKRIADKSSKHPQSPSVLCIGIRRPLLMRHTQPTPATATATSPLYYPRLPPYRPTLGLGLADSPPPAQQYHTS
ncbi:hypothetical protein COCC4DRAFT_144542 [Bipolaris maydis ATCC 48331]|uniref:Uncharacterized protein n=2 Tax=Cochliobolus heterostrophus TaxID=5016 RepID=M2UGX2_COCH5|nr:uncharacterized protein COCC4DRAFT_144542 [Bipolaris maydis ATCC 48331]EMD97699.1 hypothetical protein COCHEDRAFT_1209494 [Bipolaris maydis C5]ENI02905.1 hypothetical protein COCC4DRAFT_144542 [Bipolaris maydis ATCC 48331]KAH7564590.1 hypothetical protein BM1_01637 [Bipolaris maydis]